MDAIWRRRKSIFDAAVLLFALSLTSGAKAGPCDGTWRISKSRIGVITITVKSDGNKFTGTVNDSWSTRPIHGQITGNKIEFNEFGGGAVAVWSGAVNGDTMSIDLYQTGENQPIQMTGKRVSN
jgi:hypothetical protein